MKILNLFGFLIPFEFIWTMGASGVLSSFLGQWYILFNIQSAILVYLLIRILEKNTSVNFKLFTLLVPFFALGLWEASVTHVLGGSGGYYGWAQFVFGFLVPVLLVVVLNKISAQAAVSFFRNFYAGYILYLCISLSVLFFFDQAFFDLIESYGVGGATVALRYNLDSSIFGLLIGNANKQSNYLLILILLGPRLLAESDLLREKGGALKIYRVFSFLSIFVLLLLFSRAALMLLPFVIFFVFRYFGIKKIYLPFLFIFLTFIIGWTNLDLIFDYLLFSKFVDGTGGDVMGSFSNRIDQWDEILTLFISDFGVLMHGMGVGAYGVWLGGDSKAGSHNLFLDHLLASGLFGVLALVMTILTSILYALKRGSGDILFMIFVFILLALREYSFSYLYVTSMGGVIFTFIFYVIVKNKCIYDLNEGGLKSELVSDVNRLVKV